MSLVATSLKTSMRTRPSSTLLANLSDGSRKCLCAMHSNDFFCSSKKCQNDRLCVRSIGFTTIGHVSADDGSPRNAPGSTRIKTPLQLKPRNQRQTNKDKELKEFCLTIPDILSSASASHALAKETQTPSLTTTQRLCGNTAQ